MLPVLAGAGLIEARKGTMSGNDRVDALEAEVRQWAPIAPMKSPSTSGVCLATATTESFVPGTLVLLGSFLAHHPRFDGDLVIIHDALPQAARDVLQAVSDRVRFETVSTRLRDRLARLAAGHPAFACAFR